MNTIWQNFLSNQITTAQPNNDKRIVALAHLAVLTVSGQDAATLLQGQITCDVRQISDNNSSLGALCNPKGQVISTFLLLKNHDDFLLILPKELLVTVQARLQRVVLRSKVTLTDSSQQYVLIGICDSQIQTEDNLRCTRQDEALKINFFGRQLLLADTEAAMGLWTTHVEQGFQQDSLAHWHYADVVAGMPWLITATSEQFIPQQLNLDKLGGISFNKGCYTGQEIVARTHYLGKVKRGLFVAQCETKQVIESGTVVLNATNQQTIGKVLAAQSNGDVCCLQLVLQLTDEENYALQLPQPYANLVISLV